MRLFFKLGLIILYIGIVQPVFSAVTIFYDYDDLNRLKYMLRSDGPQISYTYDEVGNIKDRFINYPDSDGDGMLDGWERLYGLNPNFSDASLDNDSDGLSNMEEYQNHTNPSSPDSDGDGLTDGAEVHVFGTDPTKADCGDQGEVCQTCPNVRIASTPPEYYSTLQEAYDMALDGDIIQAKAGMFNTSLTFNRDISITLHGGYDCDYSIDTGNVTTLKGQININTRRVIIKGIVLAK